MKNQQMCQSIKQTNFTKWLHQEYYHRRLLLSLLMLMFTWHVAFAQEPTNEVLDNIVVRFNPQLLDWTVIDDDMVTRTKLKRIVNSDGLKEIEIQSKKLGVNFGDLEVTKMFPHLNTSDSLSVTRLGKVIYMPPFWATFLVNVSPEEDFWRLRKSIIASFPLAIYADPPLVLELDDIPNDSLFDYQLSLFDSIVPNQTISMDDAWDIETGESFIKVGVHDSGIFADHEDVSPITGYRYGLAFDDSLGNPIYNFGRDFGGHGTCVASIIGAKRNNGIGIAGIAGGDGTDSSGISLVDFSVGFENGNMVAMSIIDGARSVGSYYLWAVNPPLVSNAPSQEYYWQQAVGYGIHIGNHSYGLRVLAEPNSGSGRDLPNSDTTGWAFEFEIETCQLCREAHLFSLQNGVTNVVSRGNNQNFSDLLSPYDRYPQLFDDDWIITVGASGTDGNRLVGAANTAPGEIWNSPVGQNIDLIAPGSRASVVGARSGDLPNSAIFGKYRNFNGTSSSAPHVSGVVALLMSHYNKPCYSNVNLDPADVEYILSRSSDHVNNNVPIGTYDDSTGWGRLNAFKALKMVDFPTYQIVHPIESYVNSTEVSRDTISMFIDEPIHYSHAGPLGNTFQPIQLNRYYRAERIKYSLEYNFSNYRIATNELLDIWTRSSETNSIGFVADTFSYLTGNPAQGPIIVSDTMSISPKTIIDSFSDTSIILSGYYYHIIGRYDDPFSPTGLILPIDYWYPINPNVDSTKMAFSIYLRDTLAPSYWDFPCTADNNLLDSLLSIDQKKVLDFELYPNPSTGLMKIRLNPDGNYRELTIVNVHSQVLKRIKISDTQTIIELELEDIQNGIYFVNLLSDNDLSTKKWIKL